MVVENIKNNSSTCINLKIDKAKSRDTGLAIVLILLILELWNGDGIYLKVSIAVLVLDMISPILFKPLAYFWFGLAHVLGTIVSKVLLFFVFSLVVLPVGLFRKILGKDTLQLKNWKKNADSVFHTRNHLYSSSDIEKPY